MTRAIVALLAALTPVVAAAAPLRVAVKTRVPLTAEVAAALGAYGVVRHRLWRLDVAEMSMASPHVAGVAALLLEKNASLRQADVEAMLQATAIPIAAGSVTDPIIGVTSVWGTGAEEQGAGLVQAADALAL